MKLDCNDRSGRHGIPRCPGSAHPAAKGTPLGLKATRGHKLLSKVATIVTPDTIMAWYRCLIAPKWTYPRVKVGWPGVMKEIRTLIVQMAEENPSYVKLTDMWG